MPPNPQPSTAPTWVPDHLAGCEATTLSLPDTYDGPVVATLVRRRAPQPTGHAVLYLHGCVDYFFQNHMAVAYNDHGYDFYALDLRRHGRSLRPHQRPNFCKDLREYYAELDLAIDLVRAEGHPWLLLNGHSTGRFDGGALCPRGCPPRPTQRLVPEQPFCRTECPCRAARPNCRHCASWRGAARLAPRRCG